MMITKLIKYELLRQSPYPYIFLIVIVVAISNINLTLYRVDEIEILRLEEPPQEEYTIDYLRIRSFVTLGNELYRILRNDMFIPWLALAISMAYALSVARDMNREHLRFIFSLPIERWEYIISKIIVTATLTWLIYYLTFIFLLSLRFGLTELTLLFPFTIFREFIVVTVSSIAVAILTDNDIATVAAGFVGFFTEEFLFYTFFAGDNLYNLSYEIEPFKTLGLINEVLKLENEALIEFILGMKKELVSTAVSINNLHLIFTFIFSSFLLITAVVFYSRRDID